MSRWTAAVVGAVIALGLARAALGRLLDRPGSHAAVLVSVGAGWLGAWALWSLAGSLATRAGLLGAYDDSLFAVVVLGGAVWQYRTAVRGGRERGLVIFVGLQLAWLVVVLIQNGLVSSAP